MKKLNQEQVDEIIANHELWLQTNGEEGQCASFSNTNISHLDLSKKDLRFADFLNCIANYANFNESNLSETCFVNAKIFEGKFNKVKLVNANLYEANLYAFLDDADLSFANLTDAKICYIANSLNIKLDFIKFSDKTFIKSDRQFNKYDHCSWFIN